MWHQYLQLWIHYSYITEQDEDLCNLVWLSLMSASKVTDLIFESFCITDNNVEDISSCEPSFHLQSIFIQCTEKLCNDFLSIQSFLWRPLFHFLLVLALLLNWQFHLYLIQIYQGLVGIELIILPCSLQFPSCIHTIQSPSWLTHSFFLFWFFTSLFT